MEPIHADLADATPRNVPHEMLSRLYREIGVAAVAAALGVTSEPPEQHARAQDGRATSVKQAA